MVRRLPLVALLLLAASGCGDDGSPPDRTIAFLRAVPSPTEGTEQALLDELADAGWTEGENLTVLGRDPEEAHLDDAAAAVDGWVEEGVDLIIALSTTSAQVADEEAPDVPVLFLVNDPVASGLVEDERSPDGHVTGVTYRVPADRTLDVAMRALGPIERVGLLWPSEDPAAEPIRSDVRRAGQSFGIAVVDAPFVDAADVAAAVAELAASGVQAVVVANAPTAFRAGPEIAKAVEEHQLPVVANTAVDFALVALAPDSVQLYRQLGRQAVRLLSGVDVADVPVEDPSGFRIIVSRGIASSLGIELPQELLEIAEEVRD